jgi:hypothetical protein
MRRSAKGRMAVWVAVGSLLALMAGLLWLAGQAAPVLADPGTRYVAVSGEDTTDCNDPAHPCRTVQFAVDAAGAGDVIKVAAGVYTGVNDRGGLAQVLYISETVTVRGGYTTTDEYAGPPDSETNRTTLDAEGQGRGVYITGEISPTLEGLRVTGGDATGLGSGLSGYDAGGGVYVVSATATISGCVVVSNTASTAGESYGGGLNLVHSKATLQDNTVVSNTASTADYGWGGGLYLDYSVATLVGNTLQGNTASTAGTGYGGGLYLDRSEATLQGNSVQGNTGSAAGLGAGGGLYLSRSAATLQGNTVVGNIASTASTGYMGGLFLEDSEATLRGNTVVRNTATLSATAAGLGGGLGLWGSPSFTLTNNLVAGNQANTEGGGLWIGGASSEPVSGRLLHTTLADNSGGAGGGQGVFVGEETTLAFTNTLVAGHSGVGINVSAGSTVILEATLWHGNGARTGGGGSVVIGAIDLQGDPAFVDPAAWDYHLGPGSAAIDAGVNAGVDDDIDGDSRPQGAGYDIGADETVCVTGTAILGPLVGIAGQTCLFTATVAPPGASTPIAYAWTPAPGSGQGTAYAAYTWASAGPQTITVTVTNGCAPVEASHVIDVAGGWSSIYLPLILRNGP